MTEALVPGLALGDLPYSEVAERLRGSGLCLRAGRYAFNVHSRIPSVARGLHHLYASHPVDSRGFCDFHVAVRLPRSHRRWVGRQAEFVFDRAQVFHPLAYAQAMPLLEWGLNWCLYEHVHDRLVMHAAAVSYQGKAVVLAAPSGSGKSTLTAALVLAGWRLLSDELAMFSPDNLLLDGLARPISLKNRSIGIIRDRSDESVVSSAVHDTSKGSVALMRPPPASVTSVDEVAHPTVVVFPRFTPDARPVEVARIPPASAFARLMENAFNRAILREQGFDVLTQLVEQCPCFELRYASLDQAVSRIEELYRGG